MRILTLTLVLLTTFGGIAQITIVADNRSCELAAPICSNTSVKQVFDENTNAGVACTLPIDPFYYVINFGNAGSNSIKIAAGTTVGTYLYYGPLSGNTLDACNQIALNNAPFISGNMGGGAGIQTLPNVAGLYVLVLFPNQCDGQNIFDVTGDALILCDEDLPCTNCVTSFAPTAGKYVVSGWVKENNPPAGVITYTNPSIDLSFTGSATTFSLAPSGQIIDGWQRIEEVIEVPVGATAMDLTLSMASGTGFFDDIRFFPFDGNMMSYVYDPISLRLMAELDERNYAKLYEYDEEGKLIRVKRETERGIMTIQENRDNTTK